MPNSSRLSLSLPLFSRVFLPCTFFFPRPLVSLASRPLFGLLLILFLLLVFPKHLDGCTTSGKNSIVAQPDALSGSTVPPAHPHRPICPGQGERTTTRRRALPYFNTSTTQTSIDRPTVHLRVRVRVCCPSFARRDSSRTIQQPRILAAGLIPSPCCKVPGETATRTQTPLLTAPRRHEGTIERPSVASRIFGPPVSASTPAHSNPDLTAVIVNGNQSLSSYENPTDRRFPPAASTRPTSPPHLSH